MPSGFTGARPLLAPCNSGDAPELPVRSRVRQVDDSQRKSRSRERLQQTELGSILHEKVALLGSRRPKKSHSRADGRTWAYWATNDAGRHDLQPISYQAFRQRSGLDLLAQAAP